MKAATLTALFAAALLSGCASDPASDEGTGPAGDGVGSDQPGQPSQGTSREYVLLPGEVVAWTVGVAGGENLDLRFRVYQGLVDIEVEGPGLCDGFRVQAAAVSGPGGAEVQNKDCGRLEAGTHSLRLHAGTAAFRGAVDLRGGWFVADPVAVIDASALASDRDDRPVPAAPTDERDLVVRAGQPVDFVVRGQGKPMRLVIGMYSGASFWGSLTGPSPCEADDLSNNVMVASVSGGQILAVSECEVLAGTQQFHLDPGSSAFYGYARLYGAKFA